MRYKIYISFLLLLFSTGLLAQQPGTKHIRIVDTLTPQEKAARNPIILKAEFDSLITQFNASQPQQVIKEPIKEAADNTNQYILAGLFAIIVLLWFVIYMFYRHLHKINQTIGGLNETSKSSNFSWSAVLSLAGLFLLASVIVKIGFRNFS